MTTESQLTNDGVLVYLMGHDNVVYRYDVEDDAWSEALFGPGPLTGLGIGLFEWFDGGFYYLHPSFITGSWTRGLELGTARGRAGPGSPLRR